MHDPVRDIPDRHMTFLVETLLKLRGPGVVDSDLPPDPSNFDFPEAVRDWAHEQICRMADEGARRRAERWTTDRTFDSIVYGEVFAGDVVIDLEDE